MARSGSVEVGGYFPAPPSTLSAVSSLVAWPADRRHGILLDPCAGEGAAILTLQQHWTNPEHHSHRTPNRPSVVACELEAERATRLRQACYPNSDTVIHHGDAFCLTRSDHNRGSTVLFLNPPYDHDPVHGRWEHRFLLRFTEHLAPGTGLLFFLVPFASLTASASFLSRSYAGLQCWRLPDKEFDRFGQVLVAGRRRARRLAWASETEGKILVWAAEPRALPVLDESDHPIFEVPSRQSVRFSLHYQLAGIDLVQATQAFEPWPDGATGSHLSATQLLGHRFPVAMPPRPAHIALALASGMLNGHRLDPDDPSLPPVLAKGTYSRETVELDRASMPDGKVNVTAVDRPRLCVTVLRLDTGTFHELASGTEPTGGLDITRWTAADLLLRYGRSMSALLKQQFPPLHDPSDPRQRITLPPLARRPFAIQDQAIQASLKLLATGRNPILTAEVGTGKTTMALAVAAALSPENHRETTRQLRSLDFTTPPPVVHRTLVLCPPHLLGSWRDQAEAVRPGIRVQLVEQPRDLDRDADLYILSRETAKLGYGRRGLDRCSRCGSATRYSAKANASRRLCCPRTPRRPKNLWAKLAVELAARLVPARPHDDLIQSLAPARWASFCKTRGAVPLSTMQLTSLSHDVTAHVRNALEAEADQRYSVISPLLDLLASLSDARDEAVEDLVQRLLALADNGNPRSSFLRDHAHALASSGYRRSGTAEETLISALEDLDERSEWHHEPSCGEPLFQAAPPRRRPLARLILRHHRDRFDLLVLDEVQEFANAQSAQAKAAHRLTTLPGVPTLALTGSLMGGYASSLFPNFWALSPAFRSEFDHGDTGKFVARYGYRKVRFSLRDPEKIQELGTYTDREIGPRRVVGEAPGVHPLFLMRYLLDTAIPVHKTDLDDALPALHEEPVPLGFDDTRGQELVSDYRRIQAQVLDRIRLDRTDPDLCGRLLGALVELPSYLDRATDDLEPFVIRYPDSAGGTEITRGRTFPQFWKTPKEAWLLNEIKRRVADGERVLVFVRHTRTRLPDRLLGLIRTAVPEARWLDVRKVSTRRREAWIDRNINEPKVPVLLVNPNAVRTGLNNLVGFSTAIWYQLDYSATTYRQAIGRLHRIGQTHDVTVLVPYYVDTTQEIAFDLVARKVSASLQIDGLDVRAALESAGAGDGLPDGLDAALSLGRAFYRKLTEGAANQRNSDRAVGAAASTRGGRHLVA